MVLSRGEFEVMFSDLRIRRRSGIDLLDLARGKWPRMLVVMVTGNVSVEPAVRALKLGAFDYLRKPVTADRVDRVIDLVNQQLALTKTGAKPMNPARYARALADEGGYEVLLISPPPVRLRDPRVSHLPLDPENPAEIGGAVERFVEPKTRAGVVLGSVEQLLARHREEEIATLLERIRALLQGKGPLAVGYDPDRITATGVLAVRASIVSADAHTTLESLANPIRRLVLRRLREGPSGFTQAMEAANLDDTSLIAFHLRKLEESGLIAHLPRERYRLTSRGRGANRILDSIDDLDSGKGSGNRVFPTRPSTAPVPGDPLTSARAAPRAPPRTRRTSRHLP